MKKLIFLGLLSFVTINYLFAEEYISDEYFSEVSAQSEVMYDTMESLPIAKTVEELAREKELKDEKLRNEEKKILEEELLVPLVVEQPILEVLEKEQTTLVTQDEPLLSSSNPEEKQSIQTNSYSNALEQAKDEKKIIMLTIRSTNCKYCDEMEEGTLSDSSVKDAIEDDFININYNQDLDTLPLGLQNGATPMFIFVNSNEDILNMYPGMRSPDEFKEVLAQILSM